MRILFVHVSQDSFAGAERMLQYYASSLDCQGDGHELIACAKPSFAEVLPPGLIVHRVAKTTESFSIHGLIRFCLAARRLHSVRKFDVVHAWHTRGWEAGAWIGKVCRLPVVATLHDHPAALFMSPNRHRLMRLSSRFGFRKVICVSEAVRQACLEVGYQNEKLVVIRNGLPPSPVIAPPFGSRPLKLGFLGMFSDRKGFPGLFQALAVLAEKHPSGWSVKIAGDAPDAASKALLERVRNEHGKASWWPNVEFVGWVKNALSFLEEIDVLIVPSTDFDPFPTVLLEAAQASRPVVASTVGGVPEIVSDGVTGWLFQPFDWHRAAGHLAELVSHPEKAVAAGAAAANHVRRHFDIEKMKREHFHLYDVVLS